MPEICFPCIFFILSLIADSKLLLQSKTSLFVVCFNSSYSWLTPRITIGDPDVLKQIMIKEASTFLDREVTNDDVNNYRKMRYNISLTSE